MSEIVDATGLACPQPVVLAIKAIEDHDEIVVIVDNETALENVKRMGSNKGCKVKVKEVDDGTYKIYLSRRAGEKTDTTDNDASPSGSGGKSFAGPDVIVISENRMGRGDDELGELLLKAFIHTILEIDNLPDTMIFYNTGVKVTVRDSDVIDDLKKLEGMGVEILVCGTCTNYFEITDDVGVGTISNMYDIAGALSSSGRIIMP